jgi:hypothetical protein
MEQTAEYQAGDRVNHRAAQCPKCGITFGFEIEGGAFLRVGSLRIQKLMAECATPRCGEQLYWTSADRHMRKILKGRK